MKDLEGFKEKFSLTEDKVKWCGVDLDNTIANNSGHPDYYLDEPIEGAKKTLDNIAKSGYKIIIFTARPYEHYAYIEGWLDHHEIPYRRIICGKPLLAYMIDDKNIEFNGNWDEVEVKVLQQTLSEAQN